MYHNDASRTFLNDDESVRRGFVLERGRTEVILARYKTKILLPYGYEDKEIRNI